MTQENMNRYLARVMWFDRNKGFGLVNIVCLLHSSNERENVVVKGTQALVHQSSLVTSKDIYRYLVENEYVEVSLVLQENDEEENKFKCINVSAPDSDSKLLCELRSERTRPPKRKKVQKSTN